MDNYLVYLNLKAVKGYQSKKRALGYANYLMSKPEFKKGFDLVEVFDLVNAEYIFTNDTER